MDEIHGFSTPGEFERFSAWLEEAVAAGDLREVTVGSRYSGARTLNERWFATQTGERWRVVAPDLPFRGVFLRVSDAIVTDE